MSHEKNLILEYTREDVEWLASQIAKLASGSRQQAQQHPIITIDMIDLLDLKTMASAVAGITDPIGQLKDWLYNTLKKFVDTIINAITSAWQKFYNDVMKPVLDAIASAISDLYAAVQSVVIDPIRELLGWIADNAPKIKDAIEGAISSIKSGLDAISNTLVNITSQLLDMVNSIASAVSDVISKVGSAISSIVDTIKDAASRIVDALSTVAGQIQDVLSTVVDKISSIVSTIASKLSDIVNTISSSLASLADTIGSKLSDILSSIADKLGSLLSKAGDIISSIIDSIRSAASKIADTLGNIVSSVADKISSFASSIINTLSKIPDIVSRAISRVSDFLSRIPQAITNIISKLGDYISKLISSLESTFSSIVDSLVSAVRKAGETISSIVSKIADALSKIPDLIGKIIGRIEEIVGRIASRIADILESIASKAASVVDKILAGLTAGISKILDTIRGAVSRVADAISKAGSLVAKIVDKVMEIPDILGSVLDKVKGFLGDIADKLRDVLRALGEFFSPTHIAATIRGVLEKAAPDVVREIEATLANIHSPLDFIKAFPKLMYLTIIGLAKTVWYLIPDSVKDFFGRLANAVKAAGEAVTGFVNAIMKFPEWFPHWFYEHIAKPIVDALKRIGEWLWEHIPDWLKDFFSRAVDFFKSIPDYIRGLADAAKEAASRIVDAAKAVYDGIKRLVENPLATFKSVLEWLWEHAFKPLGEAIVSGLEKLGGWIWEHLPDFMKDFFTKAKDALVSIGQHIVNAVKWLVEHGSAIKDALVAVKDAIVSFFKDPLGTMKSILEWLWEHALKPLGERIYEGLRAVGAWIWEHLPDSVKHYLSVAAEYFSRMVDWVKEHLPTLASIIKEIGEYIVNFIRDFTKNPADALKKYIFNPLLKLAKWIVEKITSVAKEVIGIFVEFAEKVGGILVSGVSKIASALSSVVSSAVNSLVSAFRDTASAFFNAFIKTPMTAFADALSKSIRDTFVEAFERLKKVGAGGEAWAYMMIPFYVAPQMAVWLAPAYIAKRAAEIFNNLDVEGSVMIIELGTGTRIRLALGKLFEWMGDLWKDISNEVVRGFFIGMGFNLLEPYRYVARPLARSYLDPMFRMLFGVDAFFMLPSEGAITKFMQRFLPDYIVKKYKLRTNIVLPYTFDDISKYSKKLLDLMGLPKKYYEFLFVSPDGAYLEFTDRFGKKRRIPLSPLYEIPTHSEMMRMTQKDIFPGVDVAQAAAAVRGWTPDMTVMSYLLTFKYPSFEKLWKFYMRATAGMLWFKPPETIQKVFAKEAETIGAGIPIAPLDIQSKIRGPDEFKAFETALNTYFKWLEYSNFSWFTKDTKLYDIPVGAEIVNRLGGWTADSWIMADVAADIPSKIDMRWMSRYGIFMWFAEKANAAGAKFESYTPLVKLVPQLLEDNPSSVIQVSLEWFSKMLQATGLHPAWVPLVTVAENIMVISDEMTLLRTGWLHLFKEGMLRLEDVDRFLAGMLTVSYRVGYWDPDSKTWSTKWVNLPVRWLPHERKLLELRMLMDRVYDIYKEIYSYIRSAIRNLAIKPEDAHDRIVNLVALLDEHFSKLAKEITGQEMHILVDESYLQLWVKAEEMASEIETYVRIRYWWFRVSGWLLYRISYGYVTEDDLKSLIETLKEVMPIHEKEAEAYLKIASKIIGIVKREYIPTPSQLATIAEVVPEAAKLIDEVLEARRVPKEWWSIWEKYVQVKPVVNDVNRLATAYARAKRYHVDLGDLEKKILDILTWAGWTERELELLELRVTVEELVDAAKQYIPTPSQLATIAEYVPEATKFIEQVLEARHVPKEWWSIWEKYVKVKPIANDVRSMVTYYVKAKVLGVELGDLEKSILDVLKTYGYTKEELDIINLRISLEEAINAAKEYLPTPMTLATLAEYLVLPEDLVEEVLEKRHVPEAWRKIWLEYVRVKPLKSDFKSLLSVYIRALRYHAVSEDEVKKFIKELSEWGFTPKEIELIERRVVLEEAIIEAREAAKLYIPTPTMLATLAEYMVLPVKLIEQALDARHVPEAWRNIWLEYIRVRPVKSDFKSLLSVYIRALRYGVVSRADVDVFIEELKHWGFTPVEIDVIRRRVDLEEAIAEAKEYIPTPNMLATMAEYVPLVRQYVIQVLERRHVPHEWWPVWLQYIHVKPLANEVREVIRDIRELYEYFAIKLDDLERLLRRFIAYGLEDEEIALLLYGSQLRAALRAYRELVGTPRQLASMAEYSPKARKLALAQVYKMIDALPVDSATKEFLKKMWEEYIRIRPVYDEVRRYVTELINDYANGLMTDEELKSELEALKDWGLDDYEIQFYIWLAQRRRVRYVARQMQRGGYFGL